MIYTPTALFKRVYVLASFQITAVARRHSRIISQLSCPDVHIPPDHPKSLTTKYRENPVLGFSAVLLLPLSRHRRSNNNTMNHALQLHRQQQVAWENGQVCCFFCCQGNGQARVALIFLRVHGVSHEHHTSTRVPLCLLQHIIPPKPKTGEVDLNASALRRNRKTEIIARASMTPRLGKSSRHTQYRYA